MSLSECATALYVLDTLIPVEILTSLIGVFDTIADRKT